MDEYVTKDHLEESLVAAQEQFEYCGRSLSLDINEITICPEGAGLFLQGLPAKINPQSARVAVLVIGHRNTSWLVTDKGSPSVAESVTNNLGFRWLVQEVQKRTGHKDEIALAEMIFTGKNLRPELQQEIKKCLPLYWQQIRLFLTEQNPVDYVVCGGGAAMLLEQEIMGHLSGKVSWANHLARGVVKSGIKDRVMARRLVDSYGLLHSL
ncbi:MULTISPECIES: ParM/StbA family protein [Cyanophyceae]|uniref:ParM/StbA family protein n=1 Tax=Cyanophyceae TaxID=3028117 RepID=UPI00031111E8|nr:MULTISPECIES: ParM/StbA family protein [Cyanophyceae]